MSSFLRDTGRMIVRYLAVALALSPWALAHALLALTGHASPLTRAVALLCGLLTAWMVWRKFDREAEVVSKGLLPASGIAVLANAGTASFVFSTEAAIATSARVSVVLVRVPENLPVSVNMPEVARTVAVARMIPAH